MPRLELRLHLQNAHPRSASAYLFSGYKRVITATGTPARSLESSSMSSLGRSLSLASDGEVEARAAA